MRRKRVLATAIILVLLCLIVRPSRPLTITSPLKYYLPWVQTGTIPKKGVGIGWANACEQLEKLGASWGYDWGPTPGTCTGFDLVPMLIDREHITATVVSSSQWVMGPNEPDWQHTYPRLYISPSDAIAIWKQVEARFPNKKLVAPAPSHQTPTWLPDFYAASQSVGYKPRFDALAVHCYLWTADECKALVQKYIEWAKAWGVSEVWITEFAFIGCPNRSQVDANAEATKFIRWMESETMVTRYSWFISKARGDESWVSGGIDCTTRLIDPLTNKLTQFGKLYASLP